MAKFGLDPASLSPKSGEKSPARVKNVRKWAPMGPETSRKGSHGCPERIWQIPLFHFLGPFGLPDPLFGPNSAQIRPAQAQNRVKNHRPGPKMSENGLRWVRKRPGRGPTDAPGGIGEFHFFTFLTFLGGLIFTSPQEFPPSREAPYRPLGTGGRKKKSPKIDFFHPGPIFSESGRKSIFSTFFNFFFFFGRPSDFFPTF